jgi:hypothetical protein
VDLNQRKNMMRDDLVPLTNNIAGTTSEALTGFPSEAPELIPEF